MSNSVQPRRQQPTRPHHPWDSPGRNIGVGCHFLLQCMKVKSESEVVQSCPTLRQPMDCSLPGSSIHGIFQARVLQWDPLPSPEWCTWATANLWWTLFHLHSEACLLMFLLWFLGSFSFLVLIFFSNNLSFINICCYCCCYCLCVVGTSFPSPKLYVSPKGDFRKEDFTCFIFPVSPLER